MERITLASLRDRNRTDADSARFWATPSCFQLSVDVEKRENAAARIVSATPAAVRPPSMMVGPRRRNFSTRVPVQRCFEFLGVPSEVVRRAGCQALLERFVVHDDAHDQVEQIPHFGPVLGRAAHERNPVVRLGGKRFYFCSADVPAEAVKPPRGYRIEWFSDGLPCCRSTQ